MSKSSASFHLKRLCDQVIVITGASSGIGLATATAAAAAGAKVVLVARSEAALQTAVARIVAAGGEALAVVADVASMAALDEVARQAVARFGRIDTWVNNAGVAILGTIVETSDDDMRRLFETNFWGCVNGSQVALPFLRAGGGALINVGSLESDRAVPLQGIYSASKHAVKGFTDALRVELAYEHAPVSVTLVKPGAIGTPLTQHIRNYRRREARLPPPIYAPEDVAATILYAATHRTRDLFVGAAASLGSKFASVFPRATDWVSAKVLVDWQAGPEAVTPTDNLFGGRAEATVRGDLQGATIRHSAYTLMRLNPALATGLGALVIAGAVGWLTRGTVGRRRR